MSDLLLKYISHILEPIYIPCALHMETNIKHTC